MSPKKAKGKAAAAAVADAPTAAAAPAKSDTAVGAGDSMKLEAAMSAIGAQNAAKLAFELEKKTKPIYDALDVRNYKAALKLIAAAITKYGNQPILLTLKAVALERTGKRDEALALCKVVQAGQPTDPKLLNALTLVYKCADMVHESTVAYVNASRREPTSHELALQVYFAYGREGNFAAQQTQAMLLYKNWKDVKYLFWSALCMLVQNMQKNNNAAPAASPTPAPATPTAATPTATAAAAAPKPAANHLLTVAEMMIQRTVGTRPNDPIEAEHFLIYLRLLLEQSKYEAALTLLASPIAGNFGKIVLASTPTPPASGGKDKEKEKDKEKGLESSGYYTVVERKRMEADIYTKLGQHSRAAECYHQLITDSKFGSVDDWSSLTGYFDSQFRVMAAAAAGGDSKSGTASSAPPTVSSMLALVKNIQSDELKLATPPRRGPFLAELELEYRVLQANLSSSSDRLVSLIVDYYRRFSSKNMFFWDVQRYLDILQPAAALTLATAIVPLVASLEPDTKKGYAENRVRRTISAYQLQRYIGFLPLSLHLLQDTKSDEKKTAASTAAATTKTTDALIELARRLFDEFIASQSLVKNLEPTERGAGDVLLQLCAHVLIDVYERTRQRSVLVDAIAALELGVQVYSKFNFQFKFLLTRLYCHAAIGAPLRGYTHFRSVEPRYIQLDTVTHLILDDLIRYGHVTEGFQLSAEVADFHRTHQRDGPEMITMAYRQNNYSKVLEFAELNDRLQRSAQGLIARLQNVHCQLTLFNGATAPAAAATTTASGDKPDPFAAEHFAALLSDDRLDDAPTPTASSTCTGDIDFDRMIGNFDYELLTCWEHGVASAKSALANTRLNRPSHSTVNDSFAVPFDEAIARRSKPIGSGQHSVYEIGRHTKQFIRFRHLSLCTLRALLKSNSPLARDGLNRLQSVMADMKVDFTVDPPAPVAATASAGTATVSVAPIDTAAQQWRLSYSVLELGTTISESVAYADGWLQKALAPKPAPAAADAKPDAKSAPAPAPATASTNTVDDSSAAALKDIAARFSQVKAGLASIAIAVESIEKQISADLLLQSSSAVGAGAASDAQKILQTAKDTLSPKFNPSAIVALQQFLTHSVRWFLEDSTLELYASVRTALKTTADAVFDTTQRLVLLLGKHKEQQLKQQSTTPTASAGAASNGASLFTSTAVASTDFAVVRSATDAAIDDSVRSAVANIITLTQIVQSPLAALKVV